MWRVEECVTYSGILLFGIADRQRDYTSGPPIKLMCGAREGGGSSRHPDRFWRTTFWDNVVALQCVDRAGGVGQSLESHRIAALFGPLHTFLDLNIYYTDDEMRTNARS